MYNFIYSDLKFWFFFLNIMSDIMLSVGRCVTWCVCPLLTGCSIAFKLHVSRQDSDQMVLISYLML